MERKEYVNRSDIILEKHDRLENELLSLIYEYYKDSPKEKGNENTHFYKEMKISARLNPQTIKDKNLSYVKFGKILFTDNFDNCYISYSDFSNSIGAVINPQKVIDKDLRGVNFKDTTIIGSFDGCNLCDASFDGVKSDITIDINKVIYNENTNFTGVNVEGYNPEINAYNKTINKEEKQRKKILSLFDKARYK